MAPHVRIVVRDRGFLAGGVPGDTLNPFKPARPLQLAQPPRSKRGDLAMLRMGVGIALEYFNTDDAAAISALTVKARKWADRYFKGYPYAAKRPTALLRTFPNLFNLRVEPHLRLVPKIMSPTSPEPEGASPRELRRAERKAMNSESFPEFAEPTLASDSEIDQVVHLHAQRPTAAKPTMRVDAAMLRGSGLLSTLPEFLGQLARANLETETMMASNPGAVRVELDDEQAASQQHVEMNLYAGLVEAQRRRQQRRIALPGDLAVQHPDATASDGSDSGGQSPRPSSPGDQDSGDESDASTSTTASLRANLRKRKADDDEAAEDNSPPNKIRLRYHYPTPALRRYDMKRRKLVSRRNPDAAPDDPFEALSDTLAAAAKSTAVDERPVSSSSTSSDDSKSSSRSSPVPITKIRVPSRSPDGSRSASPDRIIVLRHPVMSQSSSEGSVSDEGPASGRRPRIKVLQKERRTTGKRKLIEEVE